MDCTVGKGSRCDCKGNCRISIEERTLFSQTSAYIKAGVVAALVTGQMVSMAVACAGSYAKHENMAGKTDFKVVTARVEPRRNARATSAECRWITPQPTPLESAPERHQTPCPGHSCERPTRGIRESPKRRGRGLPVSPNISGKWGSRGRSPSRFTPRDTRIWRCRFRLRPLPSGAAASA